MQAASLKDPVDPGLLCSGRGHQQPDSEAPPPGNPTPNEAATRHRPPAPPPHPPPTSLPPFAKAIYLGVYENKGTPNLDSK